MIIRSARARSIIGVTKGILGAHLWAKILVGLVLGALGGVALSPHGLAVLSESHALVLGEWLALPGVVFLGLIQMVIVPLVVCSIILGIAEAASLDFLKRMGIKIVLYFVCTTTISIMIGVTLVQLLKPGLYIDQALVEATMSSGAEHAAVAAQQTFDDLTVPKRIANIMPDNLAQASLDKNMLQIVIASLLFGVALLTIPTKTAKPFKDLCVSGQVMTMKIIGWAMAFAPYAVFGLLCNITIRLGPDSFVGVGAYIGTLLLGLVAMVCVYGIIVSVLARENPLRFFGKLREVQLLAFSTSSSAATMPFSIQTAEEKLGYREDVSRFVIPLGTTINMDGTAMYQAIAALFLCQVFGIDLTQWEIIVLVATTVGASIGTPGTPGVGIVVLATILVGIGVPAEGIALVLGVDRILDMCRTTVNVTGDLTATAVMNRFSKQIAGK